MRLPTRSPMMRLSCVAVIAIALAACSEQAEEQPEAENTAAALRSVDLPGDRLFPESLAIGPDNTVFVSGMNGQILRVNMADGTVAEWVAPGKYGNGPLFGVLADTRNAMLWACSNDFSARGVSVAGGDAGSWLKGFDLASGEGKVSLKLPGGSAVCNDMAVGPDGALYVTDTVKPRVLRWKPGATALEVWKEDVNMGKEGGVDGIAFGSDGQAYVNNVRTGQLFRIPLGQDGAAGATVEITPSRPLVEPDGMRPIDDMRFALAEGGGSISVLEIAGDKAEVTTLAEGVAQPTAVDVRDGTVWYVQGQLTAMFNPDKPQPSLPFKLSSVSLTATPGAGAAGQ
ncbi:hypothetical protein GRI97_11430 [Altererythrobacter xixiisoli]|uniref:Uncharacterized protein n=1 Tax=Croceibacterium xixiisoli TaxID=1476466 RepID=A0A6I4TWK6_9SPHN|nr:SMP-30/gluconolactonase/LRE family protein [Croceibacterium xixiisoli]MXO99599.1 hypothetical protein [Croceibacterium xixiisoli]